MTSGGQTLLSGAAYSNSCASAPSALAEVDCSPIDVQNGGGTLAVQLLNGTSASLPATFTVTASGNTSSGYGPASVGPLSPGDSQTLELPVDASDNPITVTIAAGGTQLLQQTFTGCPATEEEDG